MTAYEFLDVCADRGILVHLAGNQAACEIPWEFKDGWTYELRDWFSENGNEITRILIGRRVHG